MTGPKTPQHTNPVAPPPADPFDPTPPTTFGPKTTEMINQVQQPELDPSQMSLRPQSSRLSADDEFALRARNAGQARAGQIAQAPPEPPKPQLQPSPAAGMFPGPHNTGAADPNDFWSEAYDKQPSIDTRVAGADRESGSPIGPAQVDVGPARESMLAQAKQYPALAQAVTDRGPAGTVPESGPSQEVADRGPAQPVKQPGSPTGDSLPASQVAENGPSQEVGAQTPLPPELASGSAPRAPSEAYTPTPTQVATLPEKPQAPLRPDPAPPTQGNQIDQRYAALQKMYDPNFAKLPQDVIGNYQRAYMLGN